RRAWFAEARDFLLYDFVTDGGAVDEHVFAYSNGSGPTRTLVLFHGRFGSTAGTIRESVAYARRSASGAKRLIRRSLAEGLELPNDPSVFVAFRDARTGLAYVRSCRDLWERGLHLTLDAYQGHVYWEFREIVDGSAGQWRRLAERLGNRGVPSLDDALRELQLEPVHAPLGAVFVGGEVAAVLGGTAGRSDLEVLETRLATVLAAIVDATGVGGDPGTTAGAIRRDVAAVYPALEDTPALDDAAEPATAEGPLAPIDRAALLGWLVLSRLGSLAPGSDVGATSAAWYDELRLAPVIAGGYRSVGLDERAAWAVADLIRVLLYLPRPSTIRGRGSAADLRLLDQWLSREPVRSAMGVNTWEGVEWLDHERFATLLHWAFRLDALETGTDPDEAREERLLGAAAKAGYRIDALRTSLVGRSPARPKRGGGRSSARPRPQ
ncbi:MAG: hypothetical protein ACRDIL_01350, partial [Candidatus Limnocylindrales bacterium]